MHPNYRAVYEAVRDQIPAWPTEKPADMERVIDEAFRIVFGEKYAQRNTEMDHTQR